VVEKEVVVTERVRLKSDSVSDDVTVSEDLKREEVDTRTPTRIGLGPDRSPGDYGEGMRTTT
jgi:stress response protein YsnF